MQDIWTREIVYDDESNVFAARIVELPGCFSEGRSWEEASNNLEKALELWLEGALESFQRKSMTDAEKRVIVLEELIRQHRKYRTSIKDFNIADQILWKILP